MSHNGYINTAKWQAICYWTCLQESLLLHCLNLSSLLGPVLKIVSPSSPQDESTVKNSGARQHWCKPATVIWHLGEERFLPFFYAALFHTHAPMFMHEINTLSFLPGITCIFISAWQLWFIGRQMGYLYSSQTLYAFLSCCPLSVETQEVERLRKPDHLLTHTFEINTVGGLICMALFWYFSLTQKIHWQKLVMSLDMPLRTYRGEEILYLLSSPRNCLDDGTPNLNTSVQILNLWTTAKTLPLSLQPKPVLNIPPNIILATCLCCVYF